MKSRLSETLSFNGRGSIVCSCCEYKICDQDLHWKKSVIISEESMQDLCGDNYTVSQGLLLRRFFCPGCYALLDTETAIHDDPFLYEKIIK